MEVSLDDVDVAVVVNIENLREVLSKLSVGGRTYWIACEPGFAMARGYIKIGFGDPGCTDRLNTILFRVPILNSDQPPGGSDKLIVLLDASVVVAEQAGLYRGDGGVEHDGFADLEDFLRPLQRALVEVLAANSGVSLI